MDQHQAINHRQFAWFVSAILTGGGLVSIQQEVIRVARMDAWFSYFGPLLYALLIGYFLYRMHKAFPGKTLFEITYLIAGRFFGSILNLIMLGFIWLVLVRDMSALTQFIKSILLPNTPLEVTMLLFMLLMIQLGRSSIEVVARVNDLFYPIYALLIFTLPIALSNEFHLTYLQPFLAQPIGHVASASSLVSGWYGDIFVLGAFFPSIASSKNLLSSLKHGAILAVAMLTVFVGCEVAVFGPNVAGNLIYPSYSLIQSIHVSDFLDRVDLMVLSLWFPTIVVKIAVIFSAFLVGLASLFRSRKYSPFAIPSALFVLLTSIYAFQDSTETFMFCNFGSLGITLFVQVPLFVLMTALAWAYRKRHPLDTCTDQAENGKQPGTQKRLGRISQLIMKIPLARWRWVNRVMIGLGGFTICIGFVYSPVWSVVGLTCCVLYLVSLAVAMVTTYCEMQRSIS